MAGNVSIKLNIEGAAQLKQILEETGNTGSAAFDKLRSGLERLGAQNAGSVVQALQRITQAQQQAVAATAQANAASFAGVGGQVDYKARAADVAAYAASMDALRARFNPLFAASKAYESTLSEIDAAQKVGAISASEAAAARDRLTASYAQANAPIVAASAALKKVNTDGDAAAKSLKGGQMALNALALQSQDFFVQVTSGGGILRPLIQQGSQVVQQMQASGQGIGAFGSAAKIAIGAVLSPIGLLVTGASAAAAAVTILGVSAEHEAVRLGNLRQELRATTDSYGALALSVDAASKKVAATSTLSTADSRAGAQTIASAKYFAGTSDDIVRLTKMSGDLARVWNVDVPAAAGRLRDAINDPAAAAAKFAGEGLPAFNQALVANVALLQRSGQAGQAAKVVLDALGQSSKGAAQDQSAMSKALDDLTKRFTVARDGGKSFAEKAGDAIDGFIAHEIHGLDRLIEGLDRFIGKMQKASDAAANANLTGVADQQAKDLVAGRATAATANGNGSLLTQPGRQVLLGPVIPGSDERAVGIMQLLPSTAKGMGYNPNIPDENIAGGLTYLKQKTDANGIDGGLARYGGYGSDVGAASGYIGKIQGQDVSKLPSDVSSSIEYWGSILGLSDAQITLGKKMALVESGGRQYAGAATKAITLDPIEVTADGPTRRDHTSTTSSANAALAADQRRLSDNVSVDSAGTRAIDSRNNAADLERVGKELQIVNNRIAEMKANGDTTSVAFKQASADAAGLTQKEQDLLTAERNRLDPQKQYLRGMQDQVAANAGLTEGDQRVVQLRQQMAEIERNQGGSFSPEQRAAALGLLSQTQQQELARQVDTMRTATAGQDNLAAAYGKGYDAVAQSTAATAGYTASLKFGARGSDEQRAAAASLTAEFERQASAANKLAVAQATRQNSDQLTYIDAETKSLGMNDNARTAYLAHLQAEQFLLSKNIDLTSAQGAAYLASVDKISAASAALKGQEASLNELTGFVDNTFSTISDSIVSAFATGEQSAVKFKDVAASVVKAVEAEFIKLALINPLKNALLGTNSPDLLSVGGIVGNLLGKTTKSSATAAVDASAASGGVSAATGGASTTSSVIGAAGTVVQTGNSLFGGVSGLFSGLADKITSGIGSIFNSATSATNLALSNAGQGVYGVATAAQVAGASATSATNIALSGAGQGVYGVATGTQVGAASISSALGASDGLAASISSAAGTVATALPYIGTAISVISSLAKGDFKSAGFVAAGAAIGSIIPGVGTAIGAAVGGLISAFLPSHPLHPFEDVELNISGGKLATGKSDGQLSDVAGLVAGTRGYVDTINTYLDSVGVKISTADGNIARIGQGITGLKQTLDPNTAFNRLDFANANPDDKSNFSIAKDALLGMKFDTPQALSDELGKIAGFADAASALGIQLSSVGKDLTNIAIGSVTGGNASAISKVTDANGLAISFKNDLKAALNTDLSSQRFADLGAINAEIQKVASFLGGTLPNLLTPTKVTSSSLQDQLRVLNGQYGDAKNQSKAYGLDNDSVLNAANKRAVDILMKSAIDAVYGARISIAGRASTLGSGYAGGGAQSATLNNLQVQQASERASMEDQWRQTWGDGVVANDDYIKSMRLLIDTQNAETEATKQQIQIQQEQSFASIAASEADFAKRAGVSSLSQQLSAYDAKAAVETDTFIASWRAYYGQYAAVGDDFQSQMITLYKAHYAERTQIETDYNTTSNAALKTAQGSVTTLFGSLKDYALKLQTGSMSTLSPTAQYDLAKSQFNAVKGAAQAGDATSASQLTAYADTLLTTSQVYNGSGTGYAADFNQVLDALKGVTGAADALTNSFVAQQLQSQTDTLAGKQDETIAAINALRRELQQMSRGLAA